MGADTRLEDGLLNCVVPSEGRVAVNIGSH